MENENDFKSKKFSSFLNKTIIFSSKEYYKYEVTRNFKELKIIDDEEYSEYVKEYLKYYDEVSNDKNIDDFIEMCDNPVLIQALKSLSEIEMTVIFLLFEEQLTSSEASKILKICSDSVTRIKRRAIEKLKKYLEGDN